MSEFEVVVTIDGDLTESVGWPAGWPLPRVGEDVDTDADWFTVTAVVWHPSDDDPYVAINLKRVVGAR